MTALEDRLAGIIRQERWLWEILVWLAARNPPDWHVGAGCLTQCVWNRLSGRPSRVGVNDIDVVFFDPGDLREDPETTLEADLADAFGDLKMAFDVKNQARVHLWYAQRFGYAIPPYPSVHAAIDTWPTTATAIAVTLRDGEPAIYAPFGLGDLFAMTARPNKRQITPEIYEKKVMRWRRHWPELTVVPWDAA